MSDEAFDPAAVEVAVAEIQKYAARTDHPVDYVYPLPAWFRHRVLMPAAHRVQRIAMRIAEVAADVRWYSAG